jgi:transposase-like protein
LEAKMNFSKEEKAMWLADWRQSGKTAWTYAKENGLVPQTFCAWIKREANAAAGFVEIPGCKKPGQERAQEIPIENGEIRIHVPLSVWAQGAAAIMEGLRRAI